MGYKYFFLLNWQFFYLFLDKVLLFANLVLFFIFHFFVGWFISVLHKNLEALFCRKGTEGWFLSEKIEK
jgi:hypothetical protein